MDLKINKSYQPALSTKKRFQVFLGGSGSGKSTFVAHKVILRIMTEPGLNVLIIRRFAATIKNSIFQLIYDEINKLGLLNQFVVNKSEYSFKYIPNNNMIKSSGLDDAEKLKSITNIGSVWCEEATEIDEPSFDQVILRVRGNNNISKQFYLTFNPIDEQHWLKKRFFDTFDEDTFTLKTTYKDNAFLDKAYVKHLTTTLKSNENLYRIYACGEWGSADVGNTLFHKFSYAKHVDELQYDPSLPLHISVDFNVAPHCTMTIYQIKDKEIRLVDEICNKHPHNLTKDMCNTFKQRYFFHKEPVFLYGDRSGFNEDTRTERGYNDFTIILGELKNYKPQLRVPTINPSVALSSQFVNTIFDIQYENISIKLDKKCITTINDFTYLKQDENGGKQIEKVKDKETGQSYEKYGHCTDTFRYFVTYVYASEYSNYQNGGKSFNIKTLPRKAPRNSY